MQSPFIGVSDSCSIRHTKRENLFDVSFFFLDFFSPRDFFFFFFRKQNPANSEPRHSSVPASLADCRVQQTFHLLLENKYVVPAPLSLPVAGSFGPIFGVLSL